jgi:hypothetical protein
MPLVNKRIVILLKPLIREVRVSLNKQSASFIFAVKITSRTTVIIKIGIA